MGEGWDRFVVLVLGAGAALAAAWWRKSSRHRVPPISGLPVGAVLFASTACEQCPPARERLAAVFGQDWAEYDSARDRPVFTAAGISSVPVVVVTAAGGRQRRFAGVPSQRWLRRTAAILERAGRSS